MLRPKGRTSTARALLVLAVFALSATGCPSTIADTAPALLFERDAPEDAGHPASGVLFPKYVGQFKRVELHDYDAAGRDRSAGYNLRSWTIPAALTLYVFPLASRLRPGSAPLESGSDQEIANGLIFAEAEGILAAHQDAVLHETREMTLDFGGETWIGAASWLSYPQQAGLFMVPHDSFLMVVVMDEWCMKVRYTYPEDRSAAAIDALNEFTVEFGELNRPGAVLSAKD